MPYTTQRAAGSPPTNSAAAAPRVVISGNLDLEVDHAHHARYESMEEAAPYIALNRPQPPALPAVEG